MVLTQTERGLRSQGAELLKTGVLYRTWCKHDYVSVLIVDERKNVRRIIPLEREESGYFGGVDSDGCAGDLYLYRFGESQGWPDPASRFQPLGVHGPSMVIDPERFEWSDQSFTPPACSELIIYELHVGTFSTDGTFQSAIAKLEHVVQLGANAIELMPVADFPGERNWGYDGVALYAPARAYGHPDDLRALVDAAHGRGLAVILDVVYNHMGPDGNYLSVFHDQYFNPEHNTPWGDGFNFGEAAVRKFFAENAPYWRREFHIDGCRLDATHAIFDPSERHILGEISERLHEAGAFLIAEDERNEPSLLRPIAAGGLGFDGVWSDDFHHVVRVALTREREGYYGNFAGTSAELAETLEHGWLFRGQRTRGQGKARGGECRELAAEQFVCCISNHDQVGNRAFGERLSHLIDAAAYRAASALLCLVPYTPMLFMGQEWSASSPFHFFTDHNSELGKLVTDGRRKEFRHFSAFRDPETLRTIPDPQTGSTFENSKLRWDELREPRYAQVLELYQVLLRLRRTHAAFRDRARANWEAREISDGIVLLHFGLRSATQIIVLVDLVGGHPIPQIPELSNPAFAWELLLSSNEKRFGGTAGSGSSLPITLVYGTR